MALFLLLLADILLRVLVTICEVILNRFGLLPGVPSALSPSTSAETLLLLLGTGAGGFFPSPLVAWPALATSFARSSLKATKKRGEQR